jgi:hypothetical protein
MFCSLRRKEFLLIIFVILFLALGYNSSAQNNIVKHEVARNDYIRILKGNKVGIRITASALPKAKIYTNEGLYRLNSKLYSSFYAGLGYLINFNYLWGICSGLSLNITKINFYKYIPNSDLSGSGIMLSDDTPPIIYYKDIYARLSLPVLLMRRFHFTKKGFWDIRAGIKLNYSGFSGDKEIGMSVGDTNNYQINIFNANFKSNNDLKPWLSFSMGISKNLLLKNDNLLSFTLFLEYSNTDFLKSDYEITIPNKPITRGTYSVTGSSIGLSLQYIFTGANKRLVRTYQKNGF